MFKNTALFGGKFLAVRFEPLPDGTTVPDAEIKVRQIPVRDYETGLALVNDEPALVGLLCGKDKAWALTLAPESYEAALITGREVNAKGFFTFCQRHTEQAQKQQADMIGLMATLPEATIKLAMEKGLAMQNQSRSPISSPGLPLSPVR
jgi:hypothetical protein